MHSRKLHEINFLQEQVVAILLDYVDEVRAAQKELTDITIKILENLFNSRNEDPRKLINGIIEGWDVLADVEFVFREILVDISRKITNDKSTLDPESVLETLAFYKKMKEEYGK